MSKKSCCYRTHLFESLAFALQRNGFIVDDVLEQLADGIARFLFALLFETFRRNLTTEGQWNGIVGLETDLIRTEETKETKKKKKNQQKKKAKEGEMKSEARVNKNKTTVHASTQK